jgi:transketolase
MPQQSDLDQLTINTIRMLAVDAVQKAKSGHPGTPMDAAPTAFTLWQRVLRYDPADPEWINRDRFVLSAGHASMLLYSMIHLTGIKAVGPSYHGEVREAVTLDDIKTFRQPGSRCPGHPEYGMTSGVETTTGPLGQGASTSVGMAMASRFLAATYNRPGFPLFDYNVYAQCGDGDMMEGITNEAASLAGHLRLSNLCWIYDSNRVTIEGHTDIAFTEDTAARFLAYGWNVTRVSDANDLEMLERAFGVFLATSDRPTLIVVHSHIGYGAPHKQDSPDAHGEPLGDAEVRLTKQFFGFDPDQSFVVPDTVRPHLAAGLGARGAGMRAAWQDLFRRYRAEFAVQAEQIDRIATRELPPGWEKALPTFPPDAAGMSTRDASGKVLNAVAEVVPWLVGGSADLSPSTKTHLTFAAAGDFQADGNLGNYAGRNMHFGVREHAMCAAVSGMTLCGLRAFGSGFLIFTDYARGSIRLSSLMDLPVLHIWTHDSISLGEDGPTHQPIEQLISLRAIPGMMVIRPADANEMSEAYRVALSTRHHPVALICSRQPLPIVDRSKFAPAANLAKGAYVLADAPDGKPDVILIASGSEVGLCVAAREQLTADGVKARVVSMPCWELFDEQDAAYRDSVLPPALTARVTVEEASTLGWARFAGPSGVTVGMHSFGMSGPMKKIAEHFGFTVNGVVTAAKQAMAGGA